MTLSEAQEQFIQTWGGLGSSWGINRTMTQIHALLLISPEPLCTEDLMERLKISRGNTSMNVRELISWGLVRKEHIAGDRKEYYVAEKDMHKVSQRIIRERKKRELDPVKESLEQMTELSDKQKSPEMAEFQKVVGDIIKLSDQADNLLDKLMKVDRTWVGKVLLKILK